MIQKQDQSLFSKIILIIFISLFTISCDTSKLQGTPMSKFEGVWELQGRSMFSGMRVKIEASPNGKLVGKVLERNDNKYVQLFVEPNDIWVKNIMRSSNFAFKLTENKIGRELFAIYGLPASVEYKAEFIDDNTFGLATGNADPTESSVKYIRVK